MKSVFLVVGLLVGVASTAQAGIIATIVPDGTNVPFALENFGSGGGTNDDGRVTSILSPYVTSTGLTVTYTGDSGVYTGDVENKTRSPYRLGDGTASTQNYLNAREGAGNSLVLTYTSAQTAFNLLWGSADPAPVDYNQLTFTFSGQQGSQTYTGADAVGAVAGGVVTAGTTNLAVQITGLNAYDRVIITASNAAFEFVPGVALSVPEGGATLALLGCGLMGLGAVRRKFRR